MSIKYMSKAWGIEDLKSNKKLVFLALCDNANDEGICYPSQENLSKKTGISKKTIIKILNEIEEDSLLLTYKRSRKGGGRYSTLYLVFPKETFKELDDEYREKFSKKYAEKFSKNHTQSEEATPYPQSEEATPQNHTQSEEATPKPSLTLFNHHLYKRLSPKEKETYLEYIALRKKMRLKTTIQIHNRLLEKYFEYGQNIKVLENSIDANWKDLYPLRNTGTSRLNISQKDYSDTEEAF